MSAFTVKVKLTSGNVIQRKLIATNVKEMAERVCSEHIDWTTITIIHREEV